uniref:Uncharacterized protein n=1 Tax=Rhizophora mucronata TaxID=61149 RepID=A0A2P2QYG7_RHIMU
MLSSKYMNPRCYRCFSSFTQPFCQQKRI